MKIATLGIDRTFDGREIPEDERASLALRLSEAGLCVDVEAPFHGDAPPPAPAGSHDGLFEFEVVELFLLGERQRYLELEFGPFGHYLALQLEGARRVVRSGLPLDFAWERGERRWTGRARVPLDYLPPGLYAANAYAIHGAEPARRHLAAHPVGGEVPDFHRLERFAPLEWKG